MQAEREARQAAGEDVVERVELDLVPERFVTRPEGRKAWLREGRRVLDAQREQQARAVPRGREERITEARRRLDEELAFTHAANRCYEQHRATGRMSNGRRSGAPTHAYVAPLVPEGKIDTTDPDSAVMIQQGQPPMQGYNAQAAVTTTQIIIAAEVTRTPPDFGQLEPVVRAALRDLHAAGVSQTPTTVLADAGYWHHQQMDQLAGDGVQVLIPPDAAKRKGTRPGWDGGRYAWMRHLLAGELGGGLYRRRSPRIEPVFGQIKFNRKIDRFQRRGRSAVRSKWRLAAATHNLLKLHNHHITTQTA